MADEVNKNKLYILTAKDIENEDENTKDYFTKGFVDKFEMDPINNEKVKIHDLDKIMRSNGMVLNKGRNWYSSFNRFGGVDPIGFPGKTKEYLFFTKPDLHILHSPDDNESKDVLVDSAILAPGRPTYSNSGNAAKKIAGSGLNESSLFRDTFNNGDKAILNQLQYSSLDRNGNKYPFMSLLTNTVASSLDLPGVSSESIDTVSNLFGDKISYRSHSIKSDGGYDFSLTFQDTKYLEVYRLVMLYDEYIRFLKRGIVRPKRSHIINRIITDQFSIYKFIVGPDYETILFWIKLTGVYFTDVPRGDFSDPPQDGFKYSVSFHANHISRSLDPNILTEFNKISPGDSDLSQMESSYFIDLEDDPYTDILVGHDPIKSYKDTLGMVNNEWVKYPVCVKCQSKSKTNYSNSNLGEYIYKLKWTNVKKK